MLLVAKQRLRKELHVTRMIACEPGVLLAFLWRDFREDFFFVS
jgi:hypothetical protein